MNTEPSPPEDAAAEPAAPAAHAEPAAVDVAAEPTADAATAAEPSLSPAQCAARLAELFPACFGAAPQPLKLRIQADIQQRAPGIFSRKSLSAFLHRHTGSTAYLKALASAPQRVDLDGQPAGEVSDEHRQAAQQEVQRRKALFDERRAAERAAARDAQRQQRAAQGPDRAAPGQPRGEPRAPQGRQRAERAQVDDVQREAQRRAREEAERQRETEGRGRAERAALLRAYEASSLSRANFCALKRVDEAQLDAQLAQAREERDRQRVPARLTPPPGAR